MTISTDAVVLVVGGGVMTGGFAIVVVMVKAVIKKLDHMVSDKLCAERRERMEKDINNIGEIAREAKGGN